MIRNFKKQDLDQIMELWLETNISAHYFIDKKYWIDNFNDVKTMLPSASIYIYEEENVILGFIGLINQYIAGIFISYNNQSKGIGRNMLNYVKNKHSKLSLHVYQKNEKAIKFYLKEGFIISNEQIDKTTNEVELEMKWER